ALSSALLRMVENLMHITLGGNKNNAVVIVPGIEAGNANYAVEVGNNALSFASLGVVENFPYVTIPGGYDSNASFVIFVVEPSNSDDAVKVSNHAFSFTGWHCRSGSFVEDFAHVAVTGCDQNNTVAIINIIGSCNADYTVVMAENIVGWLLRKRGSLEPNCQ